MDVLIKVCAIAGIGVFAVSGLKRSLPEMSHAAALVTLLVIVFAAAGIVGSAISFIYELADGSGISDELIRPLIKCMGVSVVTKLACDVCRDGGMSSAASYIELIGGSLAILIAAPLMMTVLQQIVS